MRRLGVKAKYYLTDARMVSGSTPFGRIATDRLSVIENVVFVELTRRGYEVYAGFLRGVDVGLLAVKGEEKVYIKVILGLGDNKTNTREFKAFSSVPGRKIVLTTDRGVEGTFKNVEYRNVLSFLLN